MKRVERDGEFIEFATVHEPGLRRALVAAYGTERGLEATAEALAYAWQHWRRVREMVSPVGYLYRVGQSRTRPRKRPPLAPEWRMPAADEMRFEPALAPALAALTEQQRVAVVLVHGFDWSLRDVAELMGVTVSTVQTHLERGLGHLRTALEVDDSG